MTPAEDLEKRILAAQQALNMAPAGTPTIVEQAIAEQRQQEAGKASALPEGKTAVSLGGAFGGAKVPVDTALLENPQRVLDVQKHIDASKTDGLAGVAPVVPEATPKVKQEGEEDGPVNFYRDWLLKNEELAGRMRDEYERNEKSNKARTRIAAISDALSSLGNLVGTMYGAPSQVQTYQTPLVAEQAQTDREYARKMAQMLQTREQNILLQQAKDELAERNLDRQLQVQKEISDRAIRNNESKAGIATQNNETKYNIAKMQDDTKRYTTDENNKTKKEVADANNASRETVAAIRRSGGGGRGGGGGSKPLTANARMKYIIDNASFAVNGELWSELKARQVKLPYDWQKDWRRYVSQAPNFYQKYFKNTGWEQLGGNINNVATKDYNYVETDQPESSATQQTNWSDYRVSGDKKKEDWNRYKVR